MNRNRLKQNFKNKVTEERHFRLVYNEETDLYVPYENEDELRILAETGPWCRLAFGYINANGEYEEEEVTDFCCPPECLMFNDEEYFEALRYIVTYPLYNNPAYVDNNGKLHRNVTVYDLQWNDSIPLGYKAHFMLSNPITNVPEE